MDHPDLVVLLQTFVYVCFLLLGVKNHLTFLGQTMNSFGAKIPNSWAPSSKVRFLSDEVFGIFNHVHCISQIDLSPVEFT